MGYHDNHYTGYRNGYNDVKKYWEKENLIARDNHSMLSVRKAEDHYFWTENRSEDKFGNIIPKEYLDFDDYKVLKMYPDGTIILNLDHLDYYKVRNNNYLNETYLQQLHHILPKNIHMFFTGGRKNPKTFAIWDPKESARQTGFYSNSASGKPNTMWEIRSKKLTFLPNGKVEGAILRKRGKKIIIELQPFLEFLEPKHIKEMTKARLDGVLKVRSSIKIATFRTMITGLSHCVIELVRDDIDGHNGPNEGLIRSISVGRFVDKEEVKKCNRIAWDICKDLPDSIKEGIISGDRPQV